MNKVSLGILDRYTNGDFIVVAHSDDLNAEFEWQGGEAYENGPSYIRRYVASETQAFCRIVGEEEWLEFSLASPKIEDIRKAASARGFRTGI